MGFEGSGGGGRHQETRDAHSTTPRSSDQLLVQKMGSTAYLLHTTGNRSATSQGIEWLIRLARQTLAGLPAMMLMTRSNPPY
jgi:hypothetical protein